MQKKVELAVIFSINPESGRVCLVQDPGESSESAGASCCLFTIPVGTERGMRRELERAIVANYDVGSVHGAQRERETCKRSVCWLCATNGTGYGPAVGPNGEGNWVHRMETATGEPTGVPMLCRATPIFKRERAMALAAEKKE